MLPGAAKVHMSAYVHHQHWTMNGKNRISNTLLPLQTEALNSSSHPGFVQDLRSSYNSLA